MENVEKHTIFVLFNKNKTNNINSKHKYMQTALNNNNIKKGLTVNVSPILTKEVVFDLFKDSKIVVNEEDRSVFAELDHSGFYISCERLELDTEYQDITIYYGDEIQITDQASINEVANYLADFAQDVLDNAGNGFSISDKQHATNQIYS